MMWPVLSAGSQPPQWGMAPGPPAVGQTGKAEPLLTAVAACAAKVYVPAELQHLPYFLFVNGQIRNYRVLGSGLEQHS